MKKRTLTVILLCSSFFLYSQNENQNLAIADSLYQEYLVAKPGYDQIDYLVGLARICFLTPDRKRFDETLVLAWEVALKSEDLAGQSNIKILENIRAFVWERDIEKAFRLCFEAVELAEESGDPDALAFATYQLAENYIYEKGENEKAEGLLRASIAQFSEKVTIKNQGNTYKNLAVALRNLGQYDGAIQNFQLALAAFEQVAEDPDKHHRLDRVSAMYADGGIGNVTQSLVYLSETQDAIGQLKEAESTLLRAYELSDDYDLEDTKAWVCGKLGVLYDKRGEYEKAIRFLQEGLIIFETLDLSYDVAQLQVHLGDVFFDLEDFDQAKSHYEKSHAFYVETNDTLRNLHVSTLQISTLLQENKLDQSRQKLNEMQQMAELFGDSTSIANVLRQSSKYYKLTGELDKAAFEIKKVLLFNRSRSDQQDEARTLADMAEIFLLQGKADSAKLISEQALELATEVGRGDLISDNYKLISEAEAFKGNYESALSYFQKLYEHEKSMEIVKAQEILRNEQVRQNVNEYRDAEEAARVQANLLSTQNRLYLGLALLLFAFLLVGLYLFSRLRLAKKLLESRNIELADLNKTKDRFFGIIAHDIRSPIVALEGVGDQVSYYLEKGKKDKLKNMADKIGSTARNLTRLLDNLLNWALIQQDVMPHHPDNISLNEIVDQVIRMFDMHASVKSITVVNNLAENVNVHADERSINIILRNLISNALKFTHEGGTIEVGTTSVDQNSVIKIYVRDTGVGMEQQKLKEIFKVSHSSDTGTGGEKGTGLGLVLCKELVELNKGQLEVESAVNQGSNFLFTLPVAA